MHVTGGHVTEIKLSPLDKQTCSRLCVQTEGRDPIKKKTLEEFPVSWEIV